MAEGLFFSRDGKQLGPFLGHQMRELAVLGRLKQDDFVWQEGHVPVAASSIKNLFAPDTAKNRPLAPPTRPVTKAGPPPMPDAPSGPPPMPVAPSGPPPMPAAPSASLATIGKERNLAEVGFLHENEAIIKHGAANLQKNIESVGGKLFLTDQRMIFQAHRFNVQGGVTQIALSDVTSTGKGWTKFLGLIPVAPNSLIVHTKQGQEYRFVCFGRDAWATAIDNAIQGSTGSSSHDHEATTSATTSASPPPMPI